MALSVVTLAGLSTAQAGIQTVYSNNANPGDLYSNASVLNQGQAVGSTGFVYNNVRNSGGVGIRSNYARSGNGSAFLQTTLGPGGSSSKADIEFLATPVSFAGNFFATSSLGNLASLSSLGYDWYRDGSSTNSAAQQPSLRILVDADGNLATTNDRGGIVFETAYNGMASATVNTWVTENIFAYNANAGANMWTFGAGKTFAQDGYGITLDQWQLGLGTISGNSAVLGFSMGVGSGWGPFSGAVDNLRFSFGEGAETTYNFEVIPLPSGAALAGVGLLALAGRRRKA